LALTGKDPSTGIKDEVFNVKLEVGVKELQKNLSPPGVDDSTANDVGNAMIDALSLPGKLTLNTEAEDTAENIERSLTELASLSRAEHGEDTRLDMKWQSSGRNALRGVKDAKDLREHLCDVQDLMEQSIQKVMVTQNTALLKTGWNKNLVEAWCYGGFIAVISRITVARYVQLLQHFVNMDDNGSWEMAKDEIDYYLKKVQLIRNHAPSRLHCMCQIYIFLRDHCEKSWRSAKLEQKKLLDLYQRVEHLSVQQYTPGGASAMRVCRKCGTCLHGSGPCPWSKLSSTKAKKCGREALKKLVEGRGLTSPVGDGDEEKGEGSS